MKKTLLGALLILLAGGPAGAETTPPPSSPAKAASEPVKDISKEAVPPVGEIVERTNLAAYYAGKDGRARVSMSIVDRQGRERTREFIILRRDDPGPEGSDPDSHAGDQKFYIYFQRPADVNKMAYLVWKKAAAGADDDRWLYLPALDLVKRIAGTEKRTSFVGSDFFYEDVSGRHLAADRHELAEVTDNYYVLDNFPKDAGSVEFASYRMWIHRETFLPIKIEYYDKDGGKIREYAALGVETIQGHPTVVRSEMKDHRTGSKTTMSYANVVYDIGLPDEIFSERFLRQPPRAHLR